jgi:hypothetical protein
MSLYDSLHFFLDESGQLQSAPKKGEPLLVGGILIFGDYDASADKELYDHIAKRLHEVGGDFPADLHFGRSGMDFQRQEQFLHALAGDLKSWAAEQRAVYGVHIIHAGDVFAAEEGILGERHYDNRYLSMLWSLIEHLVFVDQKVAERLSPEATFHLHVASRVYSFDPKTTLVDEVEGLGWRVLADRRKTGWMLAVNVVQERDLVTMLRMALRQRWERSPIRLGSATVTRLDYDAGSSPAALYLADLYLGQSRFLELGRRQRFRPPVKSVLVPTFRRLEYGPWLELLARMQAASKTGQVDQYLALADAYQEMRQQHELSALEPIVRRQQVAMAGLLQESPSRLIAMMDEASMIVDRPGGAQRGLAKAELAADLLKGGGGESLRGDILFLLTRFSHANHTGDVQAAQDIWCEYQGLEPRLHILGAEGLRLISEVRNRRAVSLTDQFRFDEAEKVLAEIVTERESWGEDLARRFRIPMTEVPNRELGTCLGTLGQSRAFRGGDDDVARAESCFRRAISQFVEVDDIDRQWAYLGHLACDQGEQGRSLWQETLEKNPALRAESGSQFVLAIQLKGFLVFGPVGNASSFLAQWEAAQSLEWFTDEEQDQHPFGLIHQTLGMLHGRAWRETGNQEYVGRAAQQFDLAYEKMTQGGVLLKALAYVARLRKYVFLDEARGLGLSASKSLPQTLLAFKGHLAEHFGSTAWSEDEKGNATGFFGQHDPGAGFTHVDRARSLLQAVRFNYW